ncbi:uncharacterized protein [Macrobrachium rosenbergii]|uniref:uncharacterized protein n=1 Tax=Macrobrachium rosenbergii TaxID=79674 RepID=UPI0034D76BDE
MDIAVINHQCLSEDHKIKQEAPHDRHSPKEIRFAPRGRNTAGQQRQSRHDNHLVLKQSDVLSSTDDRDRADTATISSSKKHEYLSSEIPRLGRTIVNLGHHETRHTIRTVTGGALLACCFDLRRSGVGAIGPKPESEFFAKQFASLRLCLEDEVSRVLDHTLGVKPDSTLPVDDIINKIITHIKEQRNESLRRLEFTKCRQQPGETFDDFWVRLKQIADDIDLCKGSNCVDNQLKHAILVGLTDNETVQHLLRMKANTSLSDFLTVVRSREAAQRTSSAIQVEYQPAKGTMNAISTYKKSMKKQDHRNKQEASSNKKATPEEALQKKTNTGQSCYWCAGDRHPRNKCPAKDAECATCNKKGHFAKICFKSHQSNSRGHSPNQKGNQNQGIISSLKSEANVRAINAGKIGPPCPVIPLQIVFGNKQGLLDVIPDTGSDTTVIGRQHLQSLGIQLKDFDSSDTLRLQNPDDSISTVTSWDPCKHYDVLGMRARLGINVMPNLSRPLLSWSHCSSPSDWNFLNKYRRRVNKVNLKTTPCRLSSSGSPPRKSSADIKPFSNFLMFPKPEGGVWITVDMTKLNTQVDRLTHPSLTPQEAIRRIDRKAKYFTTFDALHGYWQIPLAEEDHHLTTFISPLGHFTFCRGPMGLCSTGDEYNRRGDKALYTISETGIAANKDKIKAITDFPAPTNITDLRSFMGLVNQLAEFTPDIASTTQVLRPLMSPKNSVIWTSDHNAAFLKTKKALAEPPILAHFNHTLPTVLQTDASRLNSIGYALLLEHAGVWRLVQCGSRFLADVERRYCTIELEMLAVVWAMKKCKYYLLGLAQFSHITDHKPLIPLLNSYTLDSIENPRLQRLQEKISGYVFTSTWRKGKDLCIPDALSRAPVDTPMEDDITLGNETSMCIRSAVIRSITNISNLSISAGPVTTTQDTSSSDPILEEIRCAALTNKTYKQIIEQVITGFPPSNKALPEDLLPYWKVRDQLSLDGNLILYGARILVPLNLR